MRRDSGWVTLVPFLQKEDEVAQERQCSVVDIFAPAQEDAHDVVVVTPQRQFSLFDQCHYWVSLYPPFRTQ